MKSLFTSSSDLTVNLPLNSSNLNALIKHSNLTFCCYLPERNSKGDIIYLNKRLFWINRFTQIFIAHFGGCSISEVKGVYLNQELLLIKEVTTVISASLFKQNYNTRSVVSELLCLLLEFAIDTQQETVLFNLNGNFKLLCKTS